MAQANPADDAQEYDKDKSFIDVLHAEHTPCEEKPQEPSDLPSEKPSPRKRLKVKRTLNHRTKPQHGSKGPTDAARTKICAADLLPTAVTDDHLLSPFNLGTNCCVAPPYSMFALCRGPQKRGCVLDLEV